LQCALEASSFLQDFPMLACSKSCFSGAFKQPTLQPSLSQWRYLMKVLFKSRDPQATELRDLTERRVRFVLRRLGWVVPHAEVQMSDVNGPRGGIDKHCQVALKTDVAGTVIVASVASDWRTALNKALARAARFLLRALRRVSDSRRERKRGGADLATPLLGLADTDSPEVMTSKPKTRRQ
jgi:hypothetical protein